jgi:hypothetical protein
MPMRLTKWVLFALRSALEWVDCEESLAPGRARRGLLRIHTNGIRSCWRTVTCAVSPTQARNAPLPGQTPVERTT